MKYSCLDAELNDEMFDTGINMLLRLAGPSLGYALASTCLSFFISPSLTPTIAQEDPRWMGAWWMGWLILGSILALCGSILALFPRMLPKAAARRAAASEMAKVKKSEANEGVQAEPEAHDIKPSFSGKVSYIRFFQ